MIANVTNYSDISKFYGNYFLFLSVEGRFLAVRVHKSPFGQNISEQMG